MTHWLQPVASSDTVVIIYIESLSQMSGYNIISYNEDACILPKSPRARFTENEAIELSWKVGRKCYLSRNIVDEYIKLLASL